MRGASRPKGAGATAAKPTETGRRPEGRRRIFIQPATRVLIGRGADVRPMPGHHGKRRGKTSVRRSVNKSKRSVSKFRKSSAGGGRGRKRSSTRRKR